MNYFKQWRSRPQPLHTLCGSWSATGFGVEKSVVHERFRMGPLTANIRECWILASNLRKSCVIPNWTTEQTIHAVVIEFVEVEKDSRRQGWLKRFLKIACDDLRFDMVVVEAVQNPHLADFLMREGWEHDLGVMDFYKRKTKETNMLNELFQAMAKQAAAASRPMRIMDESPSTNSFVLPGGEIRTYPKEPQPRDHKAHSIESLAKSVLDLKNAVVWYSRNAVVAVLDNSTRRDIVTFTIRPTKQLLTLQSLDAQQVGRKQDKMLRLLRIDLYGCDGRDEAVESLKRFKFVHTNTGQSEESRGKSSLSREMLSQVSGAKDIPEIVNLVVPIWENCPSGSWSIPCALEVLPADESFALVPLPGAIETAVRDCELWLGTRLAESIGDAPVEIYFGVP